MYPEGSMLYDIWTCKGETDIGWIGVTNQFTDRDPYVVVVVRSEFPEKHRMHLQLAVEIHAPRHNMIIASDRVNLEREQDVGFFYHPQDMAYLGGWGEYKAVLCLDGMPKEEITFRLEKEEDLKKKAEADRLKKEAIAALSGGGKPSGDLEARSLLGDPDSTMDSQSSEAVPVEKAPFLAPEFEVRNPEDWYRHDYADSQGKIIMFPKKARKTWQENAIGDLRHRISYYVFL